MTWALTIEVAVIAAALSAAGILYARRLARNFDRDYGPRHPAPGE
ncbi:MAG TPA: hypothetical protein VIL65_00525 [Beijerinckiaceae bacterium]|jgi:hypothetical protein